MTGKERAEWRAKANSLDVLFQIGKGGITDTVIEAVEGALNTRELIKLKVLTETSPVSARDAANEISERTGADVIQVIGGVIVLYRYSEKAHEDKKDAKDKNKLTGTDKMRADRSKAKKEAQQAAKKAYFTQKARNEKKSPFVDKKGRDKRIAHKTVKPGGDR